METYDVIVIGTGTAGQTAAHELAAEGYRVAVAEQSERPGGVCALRGCQAKKWFYEAAEIAARSNHLLGKGVSGLPGFSWEQLLHQKNAFTEKIPEHTVNSLRGNGIAYLQGTARFLDSQTLEVGDSRYRGRYIVIAVGAEPRRLDFEGAELLSSSDDFLELFQPPKRLVCLGGGFISFEFAHFAARLGSESGEVHIVEVGPRPLAPFDGDLVGELVAASEADGIRVHTEVSVSRITRSGAGLQLEGDGGLILEADLIVNGTGRVANLEPLGVEAAGIEADQHGILVDGAMRTSVPTVLAVGDCARSLQLARVADREAKVAAAAITAAETGEEPAEIDYRAVPSLLFTYPQLGMVGRTEEQLRQDGIDYWKSFDTRLSWPTYRRVGLEYAAYKILVDRDNRILGAHILSDHAAGLINTFKQAMLDGTPAEELYRNNIMTPYPTRESDLIYMLSPFLE